MPDPFESLSEPVRPATPDPEFATRLRARLTRAFDLPRGVTVSNLTVPAPTVAEPPAPAEAAAAVGTGAVLTPYLAVADARSALHWYADTLGARVVGSPVVMADGRVGHAELTVGGARLMLADAHPEIRFTAPPADGGTAVTLHLEVVDVDAVLARAVAAGATLERAAADFEYGRNGVMRDPFGHRWLVAVAPGPAPTFRQGDIGYASLQVPDVERAAAFFGAVLGWEYGPASGPQGRQVEGRTPHHGLWGGAAPATLFCCYAVDDVEAAADRVRAAGGVAGGPHREPYGLIADCTDDAGVAFALFEPPEGTGDGPAPADNGVTSGDLAYVTMEVEDSARARAFYGAVLGWRCSPGRVEDGWQVEGVAPMVGLSGGHPRNITVPMYRVDDIEAAVAAVRAAGGTAPDPEVQPYGTTASCTDDQGTRFYLGQL